MTITSETTLTEGLAADGVTLTFDFPFRVVSADDLRVLYKASGSAAAATAITSGFTVSGVGSADGGTVTFTAAPAAGTIWIMQAPALVQGVDLDDGAAAYHDSLEQGLDRAAVMAQLVGHRVDRALRAPDEEAAGMTLPPMASRASRLLAFDALGKPSAYTGGVTPVVVDAAGVLFENGVAVGLADIPATVPAIRTLGFASAGDGGAADYVRTVSEPAHPGKLQSADGAWWKLVSYPIKPQMFSDDDDSAWAATISYVEAEYAAGRWPGRFGRTQGIVDAGGKIWSLSADVVFSAPVHLQNIYAVMDQCTLRPDEAGGIPVSHALTDVYLQHADTGDYDRGLLELPNTFGTILTRVFVNAGAPSEGGMTTRARYGVDMGETKAWGCSWFGGRVVGGECGLRIGHETDHTGNAFYGLTVDHSGTMNVLICNAKGFNWIGGNIEHSDGRMTVVITSNTNGSDDITTGVTFQGVYMFNLSAATGAHHADNVGVLIGPPTVNGTDGWDQAGPITSAATAEGISFREVYIGGDYLDRCFDVTMVHGLDLDNITYFYAGSIDKATAAGSTMARLAGAGSKFRIGDVREQNGGDVVPRFVNDTTDNKLILAGRPYVEWKPVLYGTSSPGEIDYSTQEAWAVVDNGICEMGVHCVGPVLTAGSGPLRIAMPTGITPRSPQRATQDGLDHNFGFDVQVFVASGGTEIQLKREDSSTDVLWSDLPTAPTEAGVHFQLTFPCDVD